MATKREGFTVSQSAVQQRRPIYLDSGAWFDGINDDFDQSSSIGRDRQQLFSRHFFISCGCGVHLIRDGPRGRWRHTVRHTSRTTGRDTISDTVGDSVVASHEKTLFDEPQKLLRVFEGGTVTERDPYGTSWFSVDEIHAITTHVTSLEQGVSKI